MSKLLTNTLRNRRREERIPIWLMRQAGRYLPEYKKIREKFSSFNELFLNTEAAVEVTLQPLRRFDLDAAIIFSDILIVPQALGYKVLFGAGNKPIELEGFDSSFFSLQKEVDYKVFEKVASAVNIVKEEIDKEFKHVSLIGFCGAPWTVAAYIIEGGSSADFLKVKEFALKNPKYFQKLMEKIIDATDIYIGMQIRAGAEVIKIFDSWSGIVPEAKYEDWVVNPMVELIDRVKSKYKNIPMIVFPRGSVWLFRKYSKKIKIEAVAIDQFTDISWIRKEIKDKVLQGNLDNAILAYSRKLIQSETERIVDSFENDPFIFNLGHGVLPDTPLENVGRLVDSVRNYESRRFVKGRRI